MARIFEVPWTIQETGERVTVALDEEGYATFVALRDRVFKDGAFIVGGEEREVAVREIDALMCLYHHLPGTQMHPADPADEDVPLTDALKLFADVEAQNPALAVPDSVKAHFANGQTAAPELRPPEQPVRLPYKDDEPDMRDPEPPAWSTPSAVSAPESAASRLADFDGETYQRALDHDRLGKQLLRVGREMADGNWHTLAELAAATGDPEASVSARLRDLRKRKFGGHTVNRERSKAHHGLFRYRLIREQFEAPWGEQEDEEVAHDSPVPA